MNCIHHIQYPISLICIDPHSCSYQRKLCVECQYEHEVDNKQTIPIHRFRDMAIKKLKEYKPDDKSEINKLRMNFKFFLSETESLMKKIWEDIIESINQIYNNLFEQENQQFMGLINENTNLAESSYTDLEKLVQIVIRNSLDSQNAWKNLYLIKLEQTKNWLSQEVKIFNEKVKNQMIQFNLIGQSEFQSNIVQEIKPQIQSKIKYQAQIKSQEEQEYQLLLSNSESAQFQQQIQINPKPFTYQLIQSNSNKQKQICYAVAINKECSIVAAGCKELIKIYEFQQGMLKLNKLLDQHKNDVVTLNFMNQSNQFISGDQGVILIWSYSNNNKSWVCSQTIQGHSQYLRCLILNKKEDLFISSSQDQTIKFWVKQHEWICYQAITDHSGYVYQLSLNEQENQIISCGSDKLILVIEYLEHNKNWIVKQKILVDCYGCRLCFINDNLFTLQPSNGNLMHVYEKSNVTQQFTKSKEIIVTQGVEGSVLFSQQFIKQKQLLVSKHDKQVNLIRFTQNADFQVEQSIQFGDDYLFGQLSYDGVYMITWDSASAEIQVRRFIEI